MKSRAPQLHLEYRFYKQLGQAGQSSKLFFFTNFVVSSNLQVLAVDCALMGIFSASVNVESRFQNVVLGNSALLKTFLRVLLTHE